MTQCTGAPADQWLEEYVAGTLPEAEALSFEEHYFACPVCLAQVEALEAAAGQVRDEPVDLPAAPGRLPVRSPIRWPVFAGALAATIVAAFLGFRIWQQGAAPAQGSSQSQPAMPQRAADLAQMADLALPPFRATTVRGESKKGRFDVGMQAYAAGNCPAAIDALARVPAASERATVAQFYAAACRMKLADYAGAAQGFEAIARAGDSAFQEAAMYYLAQTELARNDAGSARSELEQVVALDGDFALRARRQLNALPTGTPRN